MAGIDISALDRLWSYVDDVLEDRVVVGKYVKLAYERFVRDLRSSESDDYEWVFDPEEAARYINFIERFCVHTRGELAGEKFFLSAWQVALLAQLFGWKHKTQGYRRFTTAHLFVGRKSGKSQLASAIILAMAVLDDDGAPQFVTAATKRDQAREVWDEVARCIKSSPLLLKRFKVHRSEILGPRNGTIVPLSSDSSTLDGKSLNLACLDEMHAIKDGNLYRVLASSMGSRKNPLMLAISTAGFVVDGLAMQFVKGGKAVLDNKADNERLLFVCYEVDENDKWDDEGVWVKANPGLGSSISMEFLRQQCKNARLYGGRTITEFMVKHLNIFVGSEDIWIEDDIWMCEENCQPPSTAHILDEKSEKPLAYLGLDLAATDDITALAVCFGDDSVGYGLEMHYFLPERAVQKRLERDEASVYNRFEELENVHITPGNVTDYDVIRRLVSGNYVLDGKVCYDPDNLSQKYMIKGVAYDRWNSLNLIRDLEGDGVPCDPFGQGFASLSFPSKALEKAALDGKLFHGGDEVLRWMMGNVTLRVDPSGNIKPDKGKSGDKIDGMVAAIMGIGEMLTFEEKEEDQSYEFFMAIVGGDK
jgi:phage terminase large subunit-like protein